MLVHRYRRPLVAYLSRYADPMADAEDLVQETLIRVWQGLATYRQERRFRSWLFTIAHNVGTTHAIRRQRGEHLQSEGIPPARERSDSRLAIRELRDLLVRAVRELPYEQRDVFLLRQDGGLSYKEIAELQGVPVSTALSRMHYAIQKLRRALDDHV